MSSPYDAIVVGSGPAGSAFARAFTDAVPGALVLLVEAGPQVTDPPGRHVRNIADPAERAAAQAASEGPRRTDAVVDVERGTTHALRPGTFLLSDGMTTGDSTGLPAATLSMNVGGMGAHWTAACPRPGGHELIAEIPEAEMTEALDAADALLGVTRDAFGGSPLAAAIIDTLKTEFPRGKGDRPVQPMPLAARPTPTGELEWFGPERILGSALTAGRIELRASTLATSIVVSDGVATGVRLRDLASGASSVVEAPVVFVAGDSFRTPQLLHASGIRPWALGRYLNDHSDARTFVQLHDRFREIDGRGGVTWIPYSDNGFPYHCQVMQLDASPIGFVSLTGEWPSHTVGVVLFGTKDLSPDDRLEFSDTEVDVFGMPAMRVDYHLGERDLQTEKSLLAMSRRIAGALGTPLVEPQVLPPGASYHVMGTVRLGTDPATSVCDPAGRVWDVAGLYVGGNGTIPTPTACNPTITSVALAIRSAAAARATRQA